MTMTKDEVERIEALLAAASQGEWRYQPKSAFANSVYAGSERVGSFRNPADRDLIAAAPTALRDLIGEVRALRSENKRLGDLYTGVSDDLRAALYGKEWGHGRTWDQMLADVVRYREVAVVDAALLAHGAAPAGTGEEGLQILGIDIVLDPDCPIDTLTLVGTDKDGKPVNAGRIVNIRSSPAPAGPGPWPVDLATDLAGTTRTPLEVGELIPPPTALQRALAGAGTREVLIERDVLCRDCSVKIDRHIFNDANWMVERDHADGFYQQMHACDARVAHRRATGCPAGDVKFGLWNSPSCGPGAGRGAS